MPSDAADEQFGDGGSQTADVSLFTSDETDEWATPPEFLRPLADAVDGFDLDAASGAETRPIADHAYTEEDDGLAQPWFGTVWCNPPYSEMAAWTDKVVSELHREEVDAILYLCKGDTSTDWWHQALAEATAVGMLDTRLSFGDGSESAPFASHVFVFGEVPNAVLDALNSEGAVFDTADKHEQSEQRKLVTDGGQSTEGTEQSSGEVEHGIRYAKSPMTGTYYRVTAWVDHGDGKIQAREKHEVDKSEVPQVWLEEIEDV